jgi:hypothetical protein
MPSLPRDAYYRMTVAQAEWLGLAGPDGVLPRDWPSGRDGRARGRRVDIRVVFGCLRQGWATPQPRLTITALGRAALAAYGGQSAVQSSLASAVAWDRVTLLPPVAGAPPLEIPSRYVLPRRRAAIRRLRGYELLYSLRPDQKQTAVVSPAAVAGSSPDEAAEEGLPASGMDLRQKRLLWALVEEYLRYVDEEAGASLLQATRQAGADRLRFSWRGSTEAPAGPFLYRIRGPHLLIEYAIEAPHHRDARATGWVSGSLAGR